MIKEINFKEIMVRFLPKLGITARTFRLYQTKKMVPPPIRKNRQEGPVYDRDQVTSHLDVIHYLKDDLHLSVDSVGKIIQNYDPQELHKKLPTFIKSACTISTSSTNLDYLQYYKNSCDYRKVVLEGKLLQGVDLNKINLNKQVTISAEY